MEYLKGIARALEEVLDIVKEQLKKMEEEDDSIQDNILEAAGIKWLKKKNAIIVPGRESLVFLF